MNAAMGRRMRMLRAISLSLVLGIFVIQFALLRQLRMPVWFSRGIFFAIDPLIFLQHLAVTHKLLLYAMVALIPLAATLVLGRFFCGWVCPFGAIHEFLSWIGGKRQKPASRPDKKLLRIKYLILATVVVAALAGTTLAGWLDPLALLSRSAAAAIEPAARSYLPQRGLVRHPIQPVLIGAIFLLVIFLNIWRRRFFCNTLCPLGALFGLLGRSSLLRLEATSDCTECRECTSRCTYNGGPSRGHLKSECDLCFACVADCSRECVDVKFGVLAKTDVGLNPGRRQLLGTAAVGLSVAALCRASGVGRPDSKVGHNFLRPPGAISEREFLSRCARCGQCVAVCPTNYIQPGLLEAGLAGLWAPVLNAQTGYCEFECSLCTRVCPSGAIEPLTLGRKKVFKVGTATIDRSRCLRYVEGGNCSVCIENCPIPSKALRERPEEAMPGRKGRARELYVVADACTGCGICEYRCPVPNGSGVRVVAENEDREAVTVS